MRSSTVVSVLFAAGAFATPFLDRRVLVTEDVVVTVTHYVTAGNLPSSTSSTSVKPVEASPKVKAAGYNPHTRHHHHFSSSSSKSLVLEPSTSTPKAVATTPKSTSSSTTQQAYVPTLSSKAAPVPETTTTPPVASTSAPTNNDLPKTKVAGLSSDDQIYKGLTLLHHNVHRTNHSAAALEWNQTLADFAKTTAETCVWGHSLAPGGGGYGQNIAAGTEAGAIAAILSNGFYNGEEPLYPSYGTDNPDMSGFEGWGHFSQMVWAKTESVGCYTYTCSPPGASPLDCKPDGTPYLAGTTCKKPGVVPEAAIFTVCNYYPPGNYAGEYSNVKAPKGNPTVAMTDNGVTGL